MAAVNPISSDSYGFSPVATTPAGMAAPAGIAAPTPASKVRTYALVGLCFGAFFCLGSLVVASVDTVEERDGTLVLDVEGGWEAPAPHARCAWIEAEARARDAGKTKDELAAQYAVVAEDANSFYRGTAHLFWYDFVVGGWGEYDLEEIGLAEPKLADGSPIGRTATWTWVTGDQHLSNFGAWKNRKGDVVLGVNDFDEAAIYDFRIDVWRAAVSIYNHGMSNGLGRAQSEAAVLTFTDTYVETVRSYVGNEDALLFEVTAETSSGLLRDFLEAVEAKESAGKQLHKFTELVDGERAFVKSKKTKLEAVDGDLAARIAAAFGRDGYGASLPKVGWRAREWDDAFYEVLDVARRVGSGVGSFGVGRYYVLLRGSPTEVDDDDLEEGGAVILDVKYEPAPAVAAVVGAHPGDEAWYASLFPNEAARAVAGQRALTSYADPYAGVAVFDGGAYVVRERSPWKASFDLDEFDTYAEYARYVQAIAATTATSHVRGTVAKAPATFKDVVAAAFRESYARETWGVSVAKVAAAYREQVILDYDCFAAYAANESAWPA